MGIVAASGGVLPSVDDDRAHGALLGTLVGDALGAPFEGTPLGDLGRLEEALARRIASPMAWGYTDDGEMMLAVASSLLACQGVDEGHLLATMAEGHEPARGYGKGTRAAFREWRATRSWAAASRALWPEGSRGNGAAARVAPVAVWGRHGSVAEVVAAARRSAAPTHAHPEASDGAAVIALAVWYALEGVRAGELVDAVRTFSFPTLDDALGRIDARLGAREAVARLGHGVHAIESVPLALWAHARSDDFAGAVRAAVAAGGDTDTIGAMAGALAGATYGATGIPESWALALEMPVRRRVQQLAKGLVTAENAMMSAKIS